jgi:hypothetical protein
MKSTNTDLTIIIKYARLAEHRGDWLLASERWRTASRTCHKTFTELYKDNAKFCEHIAKKMKAKNLEPVMA